ncbi:hypothetical protein PIROE2DRAFT_59993 [Piromyces sp. E2]|nr:hypothetical protein PIROE2DRAFT_59993 [Piromyces sp. E2]|eukprot:OUM65490.1 hypothetical protein PIROE2DRAFT_59993 [Piromyces sp. E2]
MSAIKTIIFAEPRCNIKEISKISNLLKTRFGSKFTKAALKNEDKDINEKIYRNYTMKYIDENLVNQYLQEIATTYRIDCELTQKTKELNISSNDNINININTDHGNNNIKKETQRTNDIMNSKNNDHTMVIEQIPNISKNKNNNNSNNYNKNINNNFSMEASTMVENRNTNKNLEKNIDLTKVDINNTQDVKKIINDKKVYALWKKFKGIESDSNENIARNSRKKNSNYHIHKFSNNSISSNSDNDDSSDSDINNDNNYTDIHNLNGHYFNNNNNNNIHTNCTNPKNLNNRYKFLDENVRSKIYNNCNNYQQYKYQKKPINNSLPDINTYRINTFIPKPKMAYKLNTIHNTHINYPFEQPSYYQNFINPPSYSEHSKNEHRNNINLYPYYHQYRNERIPTNNNLNNNSNNTLYELPLHSNSRFQQFENSTIKLSSRSFKNRNEKKSKRYKLLQINKNFKRVNDK